MLEMNLQQESTDILEFDMPKGQSSIIKVIGVGGGGNNAVDHMYKLGIIGVDFINCNTDRQVLEASPVPNKIPFGALGTGAGNNPEKGRQLAEESADEIRKIIDRNTEMVFITAGMGGGTGTGAAPVVAAMARSLEKLTVGIVTAPFSMEGKRRQEQAQQGIKELKKYVDVLLVINNDRLREQYGDLKLNEAFQKADDVLANAVKGIAEIITVRGKMNVDLEDVKTVMRNSGTAIMGMGIASGKDRATNVVEEALGSPLLNNMNIRGSKNLLLYITYGNIEVSMDEMGEITELVHERTGHNADLILGLGYDERLGDDIAVTIIATGFEMPEEKMETKPERVDFIQQNEVIQDKIVFPLDDETPTVIPAPITIPEVMTLPGEKEMLEAENDLQGMHIVIKEERGVREEVKENVGVKEVREVIGVREDVEVREVKEDTAVKEIIGVMGDKFDNFNNKEEEVKPFIVPKPIVEPDKPLKVIVVDDYDDEDFHLSEKPLFATNYQPHTSPTMIQPAQETAVYSKSAPAINNDLAKSRSELFKFSIRSKTHEMSEDIEEPTYRRRNVQFESANHSSESHASDYALFPGEDGQLIYNPNPYLHGSVD